MPHSSGGGSSGGGSFGGSFSGGSSGGSNIFETPSVDDITSLGDSMYNDYLNGHNEPLTYDNYLIPRHRLWPSVPTLRKHSEEINVNRIDPSYYLGESYSYSRTPLSKLLSKVTWKTVLAVIVIYIAIVAINIGYDFRYSVVHPIEKFYDNKTIIVQDKVGILTAEDKTLIKERLKLFQEETNITPGLLIVDLDKMSKYAYDITSLAYEAYTHYYTDEYHWLIVYALDSSGNWIFEGMQGDYTDEVLNEYTTSKFNDKLSDELFKVGGNNFTEAFTNTHKYMRGKFTGATPLLTRGGFKRLLLKTALFYFLVVLPLTVMAVVNKRKEKQV